MKRLNRTRVCVTGMVILLSSSLGACGGGDAHSGPPITITVAADPTTVQPGQTAVVTATVGNDKKNGGVHWTISCSTDPCGAVSPDVTASGVATSYQAPDGHPAGDVPVTIEATSVTDSSISSSTTVTVEGGVAITELDSDPPTVLAGSSIQLRVILVNDNASQGVTWSVSCDTSSCGSVSPTASTSGEYVTYTAPAEIPATDLAVTVTASAVAKSSVQASQQVTVPALAIAVEPQTGRVPAATTAKVKATVNYAQSASAGVTWTVQCSLSDCGSISPAASASGALVTYTAPATTPMTDLEVALVANSASAPTVSGSATITVPQVTVGISPTNVLIPLNATQRFVGQVTYDVPTSDVNWSVSQAEMPCTPACGTVSPATAADGGATTYTAPDTLPLDPTVAVTATAATNETRSASAVVTLTSGTVKLVPNRLAMLKGDWTATVTLTNTGKTALAIDGITITGTAASELSQSNDCGSSVAPKASCDIKVVHRRARSFGNALISISDSSVDSPQQIRVSAGPIPQVTAAMRATLASRTLVTAPMPTGTNNVGTRVLDLVDRTRTDRYATDHRNREVLVRLWYPAAIESGCVPAPYTSAQVWSYLSTLVRVAPPHVSTHSCLDARVEAGLHAVVFLEHGFTGTFTDYTFLAEDLASRGYAVAAIDHTGEATAVEFPDGRLEKSVFGSYLTHYRRTDIGALGLAVAVRLDDLRFVLNELERANAEAAGPFQGRLDLSHIALVGHSLGGLTTLRGLESDNRFRVGVLLDSVIPPNLAARIQQPVLHVVAGRDRSNDDDCLLWESLRGKRTALEVPGAEHLALSDAAWLFAGAVRSGDAGLEATIAAIREQVAGFLDANLGVKQVAPMPKEPTTRLPELVVDPAGSSCGAARSPPGTESQ